jgi:hypothetical protein
MVTAVKSKKIVDFGSAADTAVDEIASTATFVETLNPAQAFKQVPELLENVDQTYFKLGGVLSVIQSNDWHKAEGFESFKAMVETKFGIAYRKTMYLVQIYNSLVEKKIQWSVVSPLGWSKLKELTSVITPENAPRVGRAV